MARMVAMRKVEQRYVQTSVDRLAQTFLTPRSGAHGSTNLGTSIRRHGGANNGTESDGSTSERWSYGSIGHTHGGNDDPCPLFAFSSASG